MFLLRRLSLAFALLVGVLASQFPEFAQQYRQRLGGAIDELQRIVADFDNDASQNRMTRAEGLEKLSTDKDNFVRTRGQRMKETEARLTRLKFQQEAFKTAGPFSRVVVMAEKFDSRIASQAYKDFEPAVPVTSEGVVTAIAGFFAGLGLWKLLGWPVKRMKRRRERLRVQV